MAPGNSPIMLADHPGYEFITLRTLHRKPFLAPAFPFPRDDILKNSVHSVSSVADPLSQHDTS